VEDETGRPFVGPAGELLTKSLGAIDLPREQVFLCNVVKCRPPENRLPQFDEIAACVPYLFRQIDIVKPKVILAMGGTAAQTMLNTKQSLGALRNLVHQFRGIPLIVTYHPAALLRNPNWKKPTWDDVRIARRLIG
jgi:DNA polymerase